MPNRNYSVITNFGCHYQCPYCITKVSVNGSCGETVGADVTATAYIEDIKYCPFCGEEL